MNDFDDLYLAAAAQIIGDASAELRSDNEAAARRELRERLQVLTAWRDEAQSYGRVKEYSLTTSLIIEYRWRLNAAPQMPVTARSGQDTPPSLDAPSAVAASDYWDEKAKDRREEFLREDAENAERAMPRREP